LTGQRDARNLMVPEGSAKTPFVVCCRMPRAPTDEITNALAREVVRETSEPDAPGLLCELFSFESDYLRDLTEGLCDITRRWLPYVIEHIDPNALGVYQGVDEGVWHILKGCAGPLTLEEIAAPEEEW